MAQTFKYSASNHKAAPRKVNFFNFESDFQCPLLASIGLSTDAIADMTGLTPGQVGYRIMKFENAVRRKGEKTSRYKYRSGKGEIAQAMITTVIGMKSPVKSLIVTKMERKDLYSPRPKGVMADKH